MGGIYLALAYQFDRVDIYLVLTHQFDRVDIYLVLTISLKGLIFTLF